MKYIVYSLVIFLFLSCESDDNTKEVIGKWKLIQVLADPGDGSGKFVDVDSDQIIELYSDGSFFSNADLCGFRSVTTVVTEGTYNDGKMQIERCNSAKYNLTYLEKDGFLLVYYPCIEPCVEKYTKLK